MEHASLKAAIEHAGGLFLGLDRDGTLIDDKGYGIQPEDVVLMPGIQELYACLQTLHYPVKTAIFTNQSAIGRGLTDWETANAVNARVIEQINELVNTDWLSMKNVFVCPHTPNDACTCRKPQRGLYDSASKRMETTAWPFLMIGDRESDALFAANVGGVTIILAPNNNLKPKDAVPSTPPPHLCATPHISLLHAGKRLHQLLTDDLSVVT